MASDEDVQCHISTHESMVPYCMSAATFFNFNTCEDRNNGIHFAAVCALGRGGSTLLRPSRVVI